MPVRKMHARKLRPGVMGEESFQLTVNRAAMDQLVAALTYLQKEFKTQDAQAVQDPDNANFNSMVRFMVQSAAAMAPGDEDCMD